MRTSAFRLTFLAVLAVLGAAAPARAALSVVTTTEDLAAIVREVGGDKVTVTALAKGYQDPHFVEPKPSFILAVSRANLLVVVGRELEVGWLPTLITSSRNARIQPGAPGYLDASLNVRILEIPTGQITRAMGDVHPQGNPHYWLDPANGRRIAEAVRDRLAQLAPADRATFESRYQDFDRRLAAAEKRWDAAMAPYKGTKIVTYHRSWPNFMDRFGLAVMGYVEPKPGIPPSPSHTVELIGDMKAQGVKLIVVEPYFDKKTPQAIAAQVGGLVLELMPSVGGDRSITDYIELFDYDIDLLTASLRKATGR
ncbi:MAG: zinc ABC transporter substrate-binding protein [Acidobacteria bacterium]|nr:zinc ABC transporter substrate-binding protein [Acidobacteriota bacterium]